MAQRSRASELISWAAAAVAGAVALALFVRGGPSSNVPAVVRLDLNMPAGVELSTSSSPSVAVSADGSRIAFFGGTDGLRHLYVRRFDDSDATQLRATDTGNICFFSPDGRTIGFVTADRILKKVSLTADGLVTNLATNVDVTGGVWGADDRICRA